MKPFKSLISADEAERILLSNMIAKAEEESIPIEVSDHRILSRDIPAPFDVPSFNRAAMDGYALRAKDTFGASVHNPKIFRQVGSVFAGEKESSIRIDVEKCAEIATGAMVPEGCDAVIMVENTEEKDGKVLIYKPVYPMENISKIGADMTKGENVLRRGDLLNPSKIGAIAALGMRKIRVIKKPVISIISTGNEIVPLGSELTNGKVYDINTYSLKTLVENCFCSPVVRGIVGDEKEELEKALNTKSDMTVISGGSSVGEKDVLFDVLERVLFHGIRVRPGKPMLFALHREKPVLGLPGYPASCLTNAYVFLDPALRRLAGAPQRGRKIVKSRMAHRVHSVLGRREYLTVRLEDGYAHSVYKESSAISSLSRAAGFVVIDENVDMLEKGEEVNVEIFQW